MIQNLLNILNEYASVAKLIDQSNINKGNSLISPPLKLTTHIFSFLDNNELINLLGNYDHTVMVLLDEWIYEQRQILGIAQNIEE